MSLVSCFYCFSGRATREARTGSAESPKLSSREALCPQIARCVLIWTSLSDIRQLSGISGLIIPQNIWDYRVPEWQVESYQLLFSQMDTAVEWIPDCLESATMVRVTGGPLTGLVGELDTSDTGFRIRIRFHSMGCFRVAVPEEWIEKF